MPGKSEKKSEETTKARTISFKCKFCGESKPLSDLVVLNQYFPPLPACSACATAPKGSDQNDNSSDAETA
jgi:hypothetical protein